MKLFSLKLRYRRKAGGEVLDYAGSLPTFHELRPFFERELRRARRYERPLSLMILAVEPSLPAPARGRLKVETPGGKGGGSSVRRVSTNGPGSPEAPSGEEAPGASELYAVQLRILHVGALLRDALRETDLAGYAAETQEYVVVLPEVNLDGAAQAAERINKLVQKRTSGGISAGAAEYPAGGLTVGGLMATARSGLGGQTTVLFRVGERV